MPQFLYRRSQSNAEKENFTTRMNGQAQEEVTQRTCGVSILGVVHLRLEMAFSNLTKSKLLLVRSWTK